MTQQHPYRYDLQKQMDGLKAVGELVGKYECNYLISSENYPSDVCYLKAALTPNASEIVYASGGYDVWKRGNLVNSDVTVEEAARVVVSDYISAKAARVKQMRPDLSMDQIIEILMKGYQNKKGVVYVGAKKNKS